MDRKVRCRGFKKQRVSVQSLELKGCITIDLGCLAIEQKSEIQDELLVRVAYILIYGQDRYFSIRQAK